VKPITLTVVLAIIGIAVAAAIAFKVWLVHGGKYEFGQYGSATTAVKTQLFDSDSAKFRNLYISSSGVVCGEVNAKNRLGAYAGFRMFEYDNRHGLGEVRIKGDDSGASVTDAMMWKYDCGV
jgi:hypothetical protein